jgi:nicotinamidase-related amidase
MKTVNGVEVYSSLAEIVQPSHTALLVVDVQNDCVRPDGWFAEQGRDVAGIQPVLPQIIELVELARQAGVFVVFIEQTTLPGNMSDLPAWLYFKTRDGRTRTDYTLDGSWGQETIAELKVQPDETRIRKFRPSAFHQTELDTILRKRGIESIVVCGVLTQGCVQATTMDASFHDYYTLLAEDGVASHNRELHENALTFMRSRYDFTDRESLRRLWPSVTLMKPTLTVEA